MFGNFIDVEGKTRLVPFCELSIMSWEGESHDFKDQFGRAYLDSATSSGLGRAPLCNAGPHQEPPGTTRQAGIIHQLIEQPGHAGLRRPRAPVLSGGLRRKTQLFSEGTLCMARFLQDPTSPVQRSSEVQNPAQVPVLQGAVRCVIMQK
ncbi:hypothetical protein TNCV_1407631 [Trichonephila clavipes]|nr:hypothetical protein TNCV_1407631 [Trichonephila clavipes]